ncbi:MAG: hypothetical protein UV28_C0027G0005 [Candidatus Collierbacteria bacterium GW2011_GWE2_42_48]|nr:MAG: hypothetical protein UV28_C0027G0005 [Candidatus Collierbacteria bacterium GW2011_GWE2_42_48]
MKKSYRVSPPEGVSPQDTRLDSNVTSCKRKSSYYTLYISGGLHELYRRVDKPILLNRLPGRQRAPRPKGDNVREKEYKKRTRTRAFNKIRRLIFANFGIGCKFITLTFSNQAGFDIRDLKVCNKKLSEFIKRLRVLWPTTKYLVKPEFQRSGAVHYHLILDIGYIAKKVLADLWGHGFIDIRRVKSEKQLGPYLTKYLGKDLSDERFKGHKSYFYSNNLEKIRSYHFDKVQEFIDYVVRNDIDPDFVSRYKNEYSGLTLHEEYQLSAPFDKK